MENQLLQKSIKSIAPGDFLAEELCDSRGKVLLKRGTELQPEHTELLMRHRIFTVCVGTEAEVSKNDSLRQGDRSDIDHMFEPHRGNPLMDALYEAVTALDNETAGDAP